MRLIQTYVACPEQYDLVLVDGTQIAYLRLRSGHYTVQVPEAGGELVYAKSWTVTADDGYKGMFDDDEERYAELLAGVTAALKAAANGDPGVSVEYVAQHVVARAMEQRAELERSAR